MTGLDDADPMNRERNDAMKMLTMLMLALLAAAGCGNKDRNAEPPAVAAAQEADARASQEVVSGRVEDGLRVLTFDLDHPGATYKVYRGDYIRPELVDGAPFTIAIPALDVTMTVPVPEGGKTYFKVPDAGVFPFTIGTFTGTLEALEFAHARYREVSSQEAQGLIGAMHPFILDVRTAGEYAGGHLEGATLLPVQELARRIGELDAHKTDPVFVYCASGNRSTVAAKMLVDAGFEQVINLRHGFHEWVREGLPVVK